jgi:Fuc2NAc and GlcNAc transferase
MSDWLLLLAVLVFSLLLTGLFRDLARKFGLLDVPNRRSSHTTPTPRGGGLGIVGSFLAGILYLSFSGRLSPGSLNAVLISGSLLVAGIGLWDDIRSLTPRHRLAVHILAAALLVWGTGQEAALRFGDWQPEFPQPLLGLFLLLSVVWSINLYNFMDGIDGLAGAEGVFVPGAAALLIYHQGGAPELPLALILALACLGFLFWNWPPARIFMGDVGSGFLGFVLAALALQTSVYGRILPVYCWLILPAVFIADTTITLLRRWLRGEKWYIAHRSHAYQQAAVRYGSHLRVTVGIMAINLSWLLPLAFLCVIFPQFGGWLTFTAYLPITALVLKFNGGGPTRS